MKDEVEWQWEVALAGIGRFFDEGMRVWSKKKFQLLFRSAAHAESSYTMERLFELQRAGKIRVVGSDDVYIEVINM